ncbi:MAG: hypothetical protein ACOC9W_05930 [Persicimonas sp.]
MSDPYIWRSRYWQCERKRRFGAKRQAKRRAKALRRLGKVLAPYPCPHCRGWHLAKKRNVRRIRRADRRSRPR